MGKFRQQLVLANMYVFFGEATGVLKSTTNTVSQGIHGGNMRFQANLSLNIPLGST